VAIATGRRFRPFSFPVSFSHPRHQPYPRQALRVLTATHCPRVRHLVEIFCINLLTRCGTAADTADLKGGSAPEGPVGPVGPDGLFRSAFLPQLDRHDHKPSHAASLLVSYSRAYYI
jgi:hypothetical protein